MVENLSMELIHKDAHFECFKDTENKYILCTARDGYVPKESFIKTFNKLTPLVKEFKIRKFIFDKRELKAFHQPTMEWYFTVWKKELLNYGLHRHRKILPEEEWFKKCVEAGKASILKENPDLPLDKLDIQYFDSVEDCVRH